jgi:DNA (cytosine-5)-methyltransferase 1
MTPELDLFLPTKSPESYALSSRGATISRCLDMGDYHGKTQFRVSAAKYCDFAKEDLSAAFDLAWLRATKRPAEPESKKVLSTVDLFAGCGGLTLGISEAAHGLGISHISKAACDIDAEALAVYDHNLKPQLSIAEPIEAIIDRCYGMKPSSSESSLTKKIGEVDFLVGGPPCQGHSDLNNHTRRNDPRNDLYGVMSRAAELLQPKCILIENVPGVQHSKNQVVQRTIRELETLGYSFVSVVLNAADFGVAQNRKRHFSIGTIGATDRISPLINTLKQPHRTTLWAIGDLVEELIVEETYRSAATHSPENCRRIDFLFDNNLYELPNEERPDCHKFKEHSYKSVYGRMYPDKPSPTITSGFGSTGQGRFVHPLERRTLTPHEAARLQFFPDWFSFGDAGRRQLQKLIGNAVPPKLGYILSLALIDSLSSV